MNDQAEDSENYLNNHVNHHDDVTTNDQSFESQTIDINQLFTSSLENSNDDHSQLLDHQRHLKISQDDDQQHQQQLTHQLPLPLPQTSSSQQLTFSLSSSSTSSSSSLSSPFSSSSQTIEQSSPNQNNANNNNNHLHVPRTKLFVGRLPENCTSNHLEDLFSKYGKVTECDVVGRYGFVHMSKSEEAEECVRKLNRYSFMGSLLTVEFSTSKVHPEPGTLGRAKGVSRMIKGIRPRIHSHTPYHREPCINHRSSLGHPPPPHSVQIPPLHPHATTQIPPPLPPPGHIYGGYSSPYYQDSYRTYERDIYYETDYYGREIHYPPPHDHRSSAGGGAPTSAPNYDFDSRTYSPPPPPASSLPPPPPTHAPPPYPIYPSHRNIPIRAYERPLIDEPIPMYSSRGLSMTPHKCHHHKCHYAMHVKPYLN